VYGFEGQVYGAAPTFANVHSPDLSNLAADSRLQPDWFLFQSVLVFWFHSALDSLAWNFSYSVVEI